MCSFPRACWISTVPDLSLYVSLSSYSPNRRFVQVIPRLLSLLLPYTSIVHQGGVAHDTPVPPLGAYLCLFISSVLALISIGASGSQANEKLIFTCLEVFNHGTEEREVFCLNERSLCMILFAVYLSLFVIGRYWWDHQYVVAFPSIQVRLSGPRALSFSYSVRAAGKMVQDEGSASFDRSGGDLG